MSTDIKAIVELQRNGRWVLAEPAKWEPIGYFGHPDPMQLELHTVELGFEQNYELFAILADERNVRYPIQPIVSPRGFPEDASKEARWLLQDGRGWMRCKTWLFAAEILDFEWHKLVTTDSPITYAQLATREPEPSKAPLFREILPKLASYGDPRQVRVLLFFY